MKISCVRSCVDWAVIDGTAVIVREVVGAIG
jgi:hypothetical protein